MYLVHVFSGYLTLSYQTISTWDPAVLKVLVDVFMDMYSREKFTSEKVLVPLILRARLLEIFVYAEKSMPPGYVLEKLDAYFPQPTESTGTEFAQTYSLRIPTGSCNQGWVKVTALAGKEGGAFKYPATSSEIVRLD
ncbi:uncharacterized protein LOC125942939 [Dermacentor silvarum]|uniref:uncharacterized protein LOC125942939 n=1 Tax=Dermacentor silvarum TaxID=543639 RepID=UPI0021016917|nr:uncharacterized protein LOC125942939 [Dermacentor silvarum]